jgi:hypothetical protein
MKDYPGVNGGGADLSFRKSWEKLGTGVGQGPVFIDPDFPPSPGFLPLGFWFDSYDGNYDATLEVPGLHRGLSSLIIFVLGYKYVEHAPGNGVKIRCHRSEQDRCPTCFIGWNVRRSPPDPRGAINP